MCWWNLVFEQYGVSLSRGAWIGLEFPVAADIVRTMIVTLAFQGLIALERIAGIKIVLSSLLGIDSRLSWRRRQE